MGGPLPIPGSLSLEAQIHGASPSVPLCPSPEEGWEETMGPTDLSMLLLSAPHPTSSKKAQDNGLEPGMGLA